MDIEDAHSEEINSVDYSPFSEHICITGSADKTVAMWDLRKPKECVHSFQGHADEVLQVRNWRLGYHGIGVLCDCVTV